MRIKDTTVFFWLKSNCFKSYMKNLYNLKTEKNIWGKKFLIRVPLAGRGKKQCNIHLEYMK